MTTLRGLILLSLTVLFAACSHEQCNNVPQRPAAPAAAPDSTTTPPQALPRTVQSEETVLVSISTGEKQCGKDTEYPIEKFQAQLKKKKVTVLESHLQSDGLVHTDVCGATAGKILCFHDLKERS